MDSFEKNLLLRYAQVKSMHNNLIQFHHEETLNRSQNEKLKSRTVKTMRSRSGAPESKSCHYYVHSQAV